jgi:hypothetical protein
MLPASVLIGLFGMLIILMPSSLMEKVLLQAFCSWSYLILDKAGNHSGNIAFVVGMALPYLIYVWIWIIGRYLGIKLWLMISIILALQVTGWLFYWEPGMIQ